jgi:hypothetical protein
MSRILKSIVIIFVITAVALAAGCVNKTTNPNNTNTVASSETTPAPVPTPSDPKLAVSPDEKFPSVFAGGSPVEDKVTIKSILGDAYNISLNAYPEVKTNSLSVKVDEIEGEPFISEKILKGNKRYVNVSFEASPQCASGNYTVLLNATYHDITNKEYTTSDSIIVNVKPEPIGNQILGYVYNK